MKNQILQEVWRCRDAFAREHGYNIDAMVVALQDMERSPLTEIVDRRKVARSRQRQEPPSEGAGGTLRGIEHARMSVYRVPWTR